MTTVEYIHGHVIPAAFALLPARMASSEAAAGLLAIGFQESGFVYRKQVGGPASGFWQFEESGGLRGVLAHPATKPFIEPVLAILHYQPWQCYDALADNDVLACVFARLLLWAHPAPLPKRNNANGAWAYYLDTWRPGKPHREVWDVNFKRAWGIVAPE